MNVAYHHHKTGYSDMIFIALFIKHFALNNLTVLKINSAYEGEKLARHSKEFNTQ
jgi:hypothetical protein